MTYRRVVSKELAVLLGVLSHPDRIRLVQELAKGECDVSTLAEAIETSPVRVSQHMALLRSHRLVVERRDGRHVYYHLEQPDLARWLLDGLTFLERGVEHQAELHSAVASAAKTWAPIRKGRKRQG